MKIYEEDVTFLFEGLKTSYMLGKGGGQWSDGQGQGVKEGHEKQKCRVGSLMNPSRLSMCVHTCVCMLCMFCMCSSGYYFNCIFKIFILDYITEFLCL